MQIVALRPRYTAVLQHQYARTTFSFFLLFAVLPFGEDEREREIGFGGPASLSLSSDRAVFFSCLSCLIPDVPSKRGEPRRIHFSPFERESENGGRQTIFGPSFVVSCS